MNAAGCFTFTCPGSTADEPVGDIEVKAILQSYKVQVRVANGERASVVFDASTRRWEQLSGQAILKGVLESVQPPVFGLRLRLPISLMFVVFSASISLEIVGVGGMTTTLVKEEETKPRRAIGLKHKSQHVADEESDDSSGEGEYEIDEYLEDEFAETQPY